MSITTSSKKEKILFTTSERERETVESGVCVVREREREEGVTRVYARLAHGGMLLTRGLKTKDVQRA